MGTYPPFKVPPFNFFGTASFFLPKTILPQRVPLHFFCCFATEWMLEVPKSSPLSVFFGTVKLFFRIWKISTPEFFAVLRQIGCWKTPKGPPFSIPALWDFFYPKIIFSPKGLPFNFFDILHVEISRRVPPSTFSALWDLFSENCFFSS